MFAYHNIYAPRFIRYVDTNNTSSGIPHISLKQIKDYEMPTPCLEEQTKIANYLSNLDTKINQVTQQITQTQTFKKGLLQQMFV